MKELKTTELAGAVGGRYDRDLCRTDIYASAFVWAAAAGSAGARVGVYGLAAGLIGGAVWGAYYASQDSYYCRD